MTNPTPYGLLTLALLVAACATAQAARPGLDEAVVIRVENHNWLSGNVFVEQLGTPVRLGMVDNRSVRTFRLPRHFRDDTPIRLVFQFIGSGESYRTEDILINPGVRIDWHVESSFAASTFLVTVP